MAQQTRILVVEDADEVREVIALLLEQNGFSVSSCADADTAYAMVQRERPDLVITDLMLGATSGFDLITRVRSNLAPPVPPVVAVSGFDGFEREAMQRGAAAFVPKPFEPTTLLKIVAAALSRRKVADEEHDEALMRARSLRAHAAKLASAALSRLAPRAADMARRSFWTTRFVPRYFGFGEAFSTILQGNQLLVGSSSNEHAWPRGQPTDLSLCRDILETSSALVVPDLRALGIDLHAPDGRTLRFFAGVPYSIGAITVGALAFVDERPRSLGSAGFSVLDALGRKGSAVLSDREAEEAPIWMPSGLMSRETLGLILGAELSRMQHEPLALSLLVIAGPPPTVEVPARTAVAELAERRQAVLFIRASDSEARQAVREFLREPVRRGELDGAGLVSIEGGVDPSLDALSLLRMAESVLQRALRGGSGTLEQIVIRWEPLALEGLDA